MPPLLSEGNRHYNRARRIHPRDSVSKLGYYLPTSSASGSSSNRILSSSSASSSSLPSSNNHLNLETVGKHSTSFANYQPSCDSDNISPSSSSYSSKLNKILSFARDPIKTRSRKDLQSFETHPHSILSSNDLKQTKLAHNRINESRDDVELGSKNVSPFNSSGFSDGTIIDPSYNEHFKRSNFDNELKNQARHSNGSSDYNQNQNRSFPYSTNTKHGLQRMISNNSIDNTSIQKPRVNFKTNNSRMKRRNISRLNKRMFVNGEEHLFNQYALSELFSQSEIPGFREIFASDSYLRKFCWIVAFLFMTVLSLNDMTELITEYYDYPITVDYRVRDSARLPFPAVTVCNLNVVRFSALCSSSSTSRFDLSSQIPSELRDKLCGIQVEKKNVTDSDISDINNIGITTTTTTTTSTTTSTTPRTIVATNSNSTNNSTFTTQSSTSTSMNLPEIIASISTQAPKQTITASNTFTTTDSDDDEADSAVTTSSGSQIKFNKVGNSAEHKNNRLTETTTTDHNGAKQHQATTGSSNNGGLDLGDFSDQTMLIMNHDIKRQGRTRASPINQHPRRLLRSIKINDASEDFGYNNRPFASGKSRMKVRQRVDSNVEPEQTTTKEAATTTVSHLNKQRKQRQSISRSQTQNVQVSNKPNQILNAAAGQQPFGSRNGVPVNPNSVPINAYQNPLLNNLMSTTTTTTTTSSPTPWMSSTTFSPPALPDDFELTERQERELQENLTNWLAVMYNRDPQLTWSLGHQFDDMILRCSMKSINCTHQRSFENSFTPTEGNCFTYRSKVRARSRNKIKGGVVFEEANLASINHGLELVLNLEKSEYISGSSQVGALVMVNHPSDLGYVASEATFVAPEFTTYIGLKMVNLTRLPAPYPEYCVDSWPAKFADTLTKNSTYSQQACLRICLQKTIQSHCHCQSAFLPIVELDGSLSAYNNKFLIKYNASSSLLSSRSSNMSSTASNNNKPTNQQDQPARIIICDTRKQSTRICVREIMLRAADRVHNCECPPKCHVVKYDKTISMARWPTREDKVTFDRGKMDVNFQNLAKVIIYFQTMTTDEVTQQAVFNAAKLFSALGGIMGMYVGFSFLSVFEIFEVMSRKMWHHFTVKLANTNSRIFGNFHKTS